MMYLLNESPLSSYFLPYFAQVYTMQLKNTEDGPKKSITKDTLEYSNRQKDVEHGEILRSHRSFSKSERQWKRGTSEVGKTPVTRLGGLHIASPCRRHEGDYVSWRKILYKKLIQRMHRYFANLPHKPHSCINERWKLPKEINTYYRHFNYLYLHVICLYHIAFCIRKCRIKSQSKKKKDKTKRSSIPVGLNIKQRKRESLIQIHQS